MGFKVGQLEYSLRQIVQYYIEVLLHFKLQSRQVKLQWLKNLVTYETLSFTNRFLDEHLKLYNQTNGYVYITITYLPMCKKA